MRSRVARVLHAAAGGCVGARVAVEGLLVHVGPVDDRRARLQPVVELAVRVPVLEHGVVEDRGDEPHDLLGQADVRDVVGRPEVDVNLGVLVDDPEQELAARQPQVLPEAHVEAELAAEVLHRVLVVEGGEEPVGELPHRELRRLALHEHVERRDRRAHGGLGRDDEAREVDRAAGHVLGLDAVSVRRRARHRRAGVVLELRQHHRQHGDGGHHHDDRDAALGAATTAARSRASGGHGCEGGPAVHRGIPKVSGLNIGIITFVV